MLKYKSMNPYGKQLYKDKRTTPLIIFSVVFIILAAVCIGLIAYYSSITAPIEVQVLAQIDTAEKDARQDQFASDWQDFEDYAASPTRVFSSSRDLGSITFEYPSSWNVYTDIDGLSNDTKSTYDYTVYFGDGIVAPMSTRSAALIVALERATMQDVMSRYEQSSSKNASAPVKDDFVVGEFSGVRYQGNLYSSKNEAKSGTVIIFQMRNKVLSFFNYDESQESNFYDIVMQTARWIQ